MSENTENQEPARAENVFAPETKIREQINYGGHIFGSNFELMYFKKSKDKFEYQFNLYLDVSLFERDEKPLLVTDFGKQTISGTGYDIFTNENFELLAAVEAHLCAKEILDIPQTFEITGYEVDGQLLTIEAYSVEKNGTKERKDKKSDYNGGFTQVIQASGDLLKGVYVALLRYAADVQVIPVFVQAKKVILGE